MKRIHLNGLLLIDCPASALNNSGEKIANARTDNTSATKFIKTKQGNFPYLSAQAFRFWLRDGFPEKEKSPVERASKIAYTQADPISYSEDDLFGYMRAEEKKESLTRLSPLKVSTFVSIAPLYSMTQDFGVMARFDVMKENKEINEKSKEENKEPKIDPVPYEHEFYRTTLKGLISLDMSMVGRFYHIPRAGYRHLAKDKFEQAKKLNLNSYDNDKAVELSKDERIRRIELLMESLKDITGGAKQSIHYTDVNPKLVMLAVLSNGNNLFSNVLTSDEKGLPKINFESLKEVLSVFKEEIKSKIYIGLPKGYLDEQRDELEKVLKESGNNYILSHPKTVIENFILDLKEEKSNSSWLV